MLSITYSLSSTMALQCHGLAALPVSLAYLGTQHPNFALPSVQQVRIWTKTKEQPYPTSPIYAERTKHPGLAVLSESPWRSGGHRHIPYIRTP